MFRCGRLLACAVRVFLLVCLAQGPALAQPSTDTQAKELYQVFREYRRSLSSERNLSMFFSRRQLEELIGDVESAPNRDIDTAVRAARNRLHFGNEIKVVYSYESFPTEDGDKGIRLVCACTNFASGYGAIEISFVNENDRWRISFLSFDSSVKGPPAKPTIIDAF